MVDNGKIIQIMPAGKWWAFYAGEKDEVFLEKLVCWVVVTRDGAEVVEGMSNAGVCICGDRRGSKEEGASDDRGWKTNTKEPVKKAASPLALPVRGLDGLWSLTSIGNTASGGAPTAAVSGGREPMMITMMTATV